jgi:hypothetical protein
MTDRFNGINLRSKATVLQQMADCSAGGSLEIIENTESRFTVQYDQCRERFIDNNGTEVELLTDGLIDLQGIITISGSNGSLESNTTLENLTIQTSIVSSGILLEDIFANFAGSNTVTINDFTTCGTDFTGPFSLTTNGTIQISQVVSADEGDGTATDTSVTFTNYTANGVATGSTDANCVISFTEIDVATSGGVSFTDNNNPGESFSISSPVSDPLRINERVEPGGTSYTLNGRMMVSVNESCIDETSLTFTFATTERIFVPDFAKCPTAGKLIVTLNDDDITVTYTASGGVEVIAGDTVETFDSCDDIDACRDSI